MLIAITDLCYMNSQRCDLKAFEYVYLWCEFQLSERLAYSDGPTTLSLSQREFVFIYLWNVRKGGCTALGKPLLAPSTWMSLGFLLNSQLFGQTNELRTQGWVGSVLCWRLVSGLAKFYLLAHVSHEHGCRFDGLEGLSLSAEWIFLQSCFSIFWKWKLIIFAILLVHSFFFQNSFTKSEYFVLPDLQAPKLIYRRNLICVSKCLILDKS